MRKLKRIARSCIEETSIPLSSMVESNATTRVSARQDQLDDTWLRLHGANTATLHNTHRDNRLHCCTIHTDDGLEIGMDNNNGHRMTRSQPITYGRPALPMPRNRRNPDRHENSSHNHRDHMVSLSMFSQAPTRRSALTKTNLSFFITLLSVAILAYHHDLYVHCLDSPVKIQRNKLQQQQQQQQTARPGSKQVVVGNFTLNVDDTSSSLSRQNTDHSPETAIITSSELDLHPKREDRVRRTNEVGSASPRRGTRLELECPSRRLLQSLLPPEYVGSPAMQAGGQRQPRGTCDCLLDLTGWHVTCVAGDETSLLLMNPNVDTRRLPNQLHPAFRGPQLQQRHKQQLQVSNMVAANRRVHRSPTRWMGEDSTPSGGVHRTADSINDRHTSPSMGSAAVVEPSSSSDGSVHEGFGEETSAQTTPKPGSRSRAMSNSSSSSSSIQAASADSDSFLSLPSSASFSMMMQGEHNNNNNNNNNNNQSHSSEDRETLRSAAASDNNEKLINQNNHNSNNNDHLMYETVPVLFSVKYTTTKNMIEIDCDKAAPNYKAAMFQGFNVNEVSSFTFNNCQLPNIPFSVLLHRTRPAAAASAAATAGGGSSSGGMQSLRPSRTRQNQNLLVRRSAINQEDGRGEHDEMATSGGSSSEALAGSSDSAPHSPPSNRIASLLPAASDSSAGSAELPLASSNARPQSSAVGNEPKIRSLTVNLEGVVVDQRTLISLLTGLDQLEDLQLNYMQLNLTSFIREPSAMRTGGGGNSFDLEADPSISITTASAAEQTGSNVVPRPPSDRTQAPPGDRRTTTTTQLSSGQQVAPASSTTPSSTTTTTSTTTTAAPTTQVSSANPNKTTTNSITSTVNRNTVTTSLNPTVSQTATAATTNRPLVPQIVTTQSRRQPVSLLKPVTSTATRPPTSMGSPRGLIIAQATGSPPPTTTPASTTVIVMQTSTTTTTTPPPPPQPTPAATVPLVTLATVTQQVKPMMRQQQVTNTIAATTQQRGPQMATTNAGNNIISVGPSVQSVSYTSQPAQTSSNTQRSQQTFNHHQQQPTSNLMNNNIQNRLHSSPSAWFTSQQQPPPPPPPSTTIIDQQQQPSAGSRLSGMSSSSSGGGTMSVESSSGSSSTTPWTTATTASLGGGLSAPINTPGTYAFGIRTATNNFMHSQPPQTTRAEVGLRTIGQSLGLPTTMTTSSSSSTRVQTSSSNNNDNFVAAGGRLTAAANQPPRRRPQNNNNNNNNNIPPSTSFGSSDEFTNPFAASSSSSSSFSDSLMTNALTDDTGMSSSESTRTIPGGRFKRFALDSSSMMDEFELSFGEILPNLQRLKLESFVDLSALAGDKTAPANRPQNPRRSAIVRGALSRPKRQFQANDAPERDELDAAESAPSQHRFDGETDMLLAEESHNSMAAAASSAAPDDESSGGSSSSTSDTLAAASDSGGSANDNPPPAKAKQIAMILNKLFSKLNHLTQLRLESNDIPLWPDNVLHDSRQSLARLYLRSNNIRHLGRNSFANLSSLGVLDLSANQIRQLNADLFRDLKNLHNIKAGRNLIRSLPSRLLLAQPRNFRNPPLDVDFSKNRYLSQLAADTFQPTTTTTTTTTTTLSKQPLASINNLNLSDCSLTDQIQTLTTGAASSKSPFEYLFASMPDVTSLSLNGNKFRALLNLAGLFAKNYQLKELDFSRNRISALSGNLFNSNATHIARLQLSHNQISEIPDQFLFHLRGLKSLSLAHNRISQLPADMFFTNQQIESIDLNHNQLIRLNAQTGGAPFGHAANLKFLNFAHNNLSNFHSEVFQIEWQLYTSLRELDLSHNQFASQISMPIFNIVADEMSLNLGWNRIESIDMEDLTEHEKLIDQYVAAESQPVAPSGGRSGQHQQNAVKVSTVSVELTENPIVCDCLLEPLITYAKRVEDATNPSRPSAVAAASTSLDGMSRYSVLSDSDLGAGSQPSSNQRQQQQPPQLLYQFKLNGVSCAKPNNLRGQRLSQVSRADLLCPISDEKLCPKPCECFYQSISRTTIIDCDNRQLTMIPDQLTNSSNFAHVNVESLFVVAENRTGTNTDHVPSSKSFDNINRIIIRLNNNQLRSIEPLGKLFEIVTESQLVAEPAATTNEKNRFTRLASGDSLEEQLFGSAELAAESFRPQAQPLVAAVAVDSPSSTNNIKKTIVSPVVIGRNMHGTAKQRSRRETTTTSAGDSFVNSNNNNNNNNNGLDTNTAITSVYGAESSGYEEPSGAEQPMLVEEGAGMMRKKKPSSQPMYCELYLDNNLIDSIPDSFLEVLDRIRSSSMRSQPTLPQQAALPSSMQEPPSHVKIDHHLVGASDHELFALGGGGPASRAEPLVASSSNEIPSLRPLKPEQKEAILENVRLNRQQQQQAVMAISPSLLVLSLKRNNLASINSRVLHRLSKMIHSSNTKIFLGHNPFNCSDNFFSAPLAQAPASPSNSIETDQTELEAASAQELPPLDCPVGQFKSWLTKHHSSVGDLDELYCVHMPAELSEKLKLTNSSSPARPRLSAGAGTPRLLQAQFDKLNNNNNQFDHLWPESNSSTLISKEGLTWNSSLLAASARLIDLSLYDICPYSGPLIDPTASGLLSPVNQQILISVAIVFILISLLLLMMLVYFGDTQTILAFTYIHMNPIYKCLRLNESHLDGDKLYDAFVSYTDADRDIVMALVEKLEQQQRWASADQQQQPVGIGTLNRRSKLSDGGDTGSDKSSTHEALVGDLNRRPDGQRSQDTLNRSSSRITMDDQFGGSAPDVSQSSPKLNGSAANGPAADSNSNYNKPYRLCIHERDWLPGHLISWNIVNSVQNSRRTILILSKDFIKSTWFQVEFQTAYYQMIEDKIDRLIVIVRGELPPKHELDKNLAFLLTTKTYLKWGDKWFWERLHYALPHRVSPPTMMGRAKQQRVAPLKQHHHRTPTKPESVSVTATNGWKKSSSRDLLSPSSNSSNQKPLIMSSIGKDCSNLLLPVHHNNHNSSSSSLLLRQSGDSAPIINSSSSSSSQSSNHTRSSAASSFFGGSATTATTNGGGGKNDLTSPTDKSSTTRLTIGPVTTISSSSNSSSSSSSNNQSTADSGRVTANLSSASSLLTGRSSTPVGGSGGVTNIILEGGGGQQQLQQASSKFRQKKQEKLHNFVEQTIADRFNLSEL